MHKFIVTTALALLATSAAAQQDNVTETGLAEAAAGESVELYTVTINTLGLVGDSVPTAAILIGNDPELTYQGCRGTCRWRFVIRSGQFVLDEIEAGTGDKHFYELVGADVKSLNPVNFFDGVRLVLRGEPAYLTTRSTPTETDAALRADIDRLESELETAKNGLETAAVAAEGQQATIDQLNADLVAAVAAGINARDAANMAISGLHSICNDGIRETDPMPCIGIEDINVVDALIYFDNLFGSMTAQALIADPIAFNETLNELLGRPDDEG